MLAYIPVILISKLGVKIVPWIPYGKFRFARVGLKNNQRMGMRSVNFCIFVILPANDRCYFHDRLDYDSRVLLVIDIISQSLIRHSWLLRDLLVDCKVLLDILHRRILRCNPKNSVNNFSLTI